MNNKYRAKLYILLYLVLLFLIVLYGFHDTGGTDFNAQLSVLENSEGGTLFYVFESYLRDNNLAVLYQIIYSFLHNFLGISSRFYIALITLVYFCLIISIVQNYSKKKYIGKKTPAYVLYVYLFSILSFCPILFTISRNLCAILFLYMGLLLAIKNKYILSLIPFALALFVHEGVKIMYAILFVGVVFYYFWLRKNRNYYVRNIIIVATSIILFLFGSSLFSSITTFWFEQGMLSELYMDMYGSSKAGDGVYKLVIVLSMLGPLLCLYINCLLDKRNNCIYGITVAGLFLVCFLFNQKIFLVQRIMMFMPVFIGLTSYQICSDYIQKNGKMNQLYILTLWLLPLNVLFQFVIQFRIFFGNFF